MLRENNRPHRKPDCNRPSLDDNPYRERFSRIFKENRDSRRKC